MKTHRPTVRQIVNIKVVGWLCIILGGFYSYNIFFAVLAFFRFTQESGFNKFEMISYLFPSQIIWIIFLLFSLALVVMGIGLNKRSRWALYSFTILSSVVILIIISVSVYAIYMIKNNNNMESEMLTFSLMTQGTYYLAICWLLVRTMLVLWAKKYRVLFR